MGPTNHMEPDMIDIIIPTNDGWQHLEICLESVEKFTRNEYRVIIVDSASKLDDTKRVLSEAKKRGHTVVHLGSNESFSKAINAGLEVSKNKYICLLNDDAYVLPGWDAVMVADLADKAVGMVGATMPGGAAGLQGGSELVDVIKVPFLVMAHVMFRRDVLDAVGPLDAETFAGFGSEDLDYSFRVREAGFKLKVSNIKTLHVGGASMSRGVGPEGRSREYGRMHNRLVEKWGREYVNRETRVFPRVALCVPTYNGKVDNDFFQSAMSLQKTGSFELELFQTKRIVIHYARERIVEAILEDDRFDYVWWLDDDMVFPPDTLARLMAHQKPIVTALAYQRRAPYAPCIFEWKGVPSGKLDKDKVGGMYEHLNGTENGGLRRIDGCGSACVLVNMDVYRQLDKAGARPFYDNKSFGEDLYFCRQCNLADPEIKIYCDTDLIIGHLGEPVIVDEAHVAQWKAFQAQQKAHGGFAR